MRRVMIGVLLAVAVAVRAEGASVLAAPENVTWDGLDVVVYGTAADVQVFSESGELIYSCGPVADDRCGVMVPEHGGERITVRVIDTQGDAYEFQVYLARHVEVGKWTLRKLEDILERIIQLPHDVTVELIANLTVDVNSPGYRELQLAVSELMYTGVFGQAHDAADQLSRALEDLEQAAPDWENGPDYRGPGYTPRESAVTPCDPDEWKRLSICFPMHIGIKPQATYYFRMDIPQHIAESWESYRQLFRAISWGLWIWFAAWLIRQFWPRFSA